MSTRPKLQFGQQIQRKQAEDNELPRFVMASTDLVGSLYGSIWAEIPTKAFTGSCKIDDRGQSLKPLQR